MNRSTSHLITLHTSLYFRRWSRKAYAAFCSVGREVTIGHLSKTIIDASLSKQALELENTTSAIDDLLEQKMSTDAQNVDPLSAIVEKEWIAISCQQQVNATPAPFINIDF